MALEVFGVVLPTMTASSGGAVPTPPNNTTTFLRGDGVFAVPSGGGGGGGDLLAANNLSDVASASTSRTNLGLGTAATLASSAVAQTANNLSDLASAATARTNLGLGTAATLAATAVAQVANDLSDLASASTARTNLGLATVAASASAADLTTGTLPAARLGGIVLTASTGTFTLANGKTFTVSNTLTLAGTDASTLNVGAGGTLGTGAFAAVGAALGANSDITSLSGLTTPLSGAQGGTGVANTGKTLTLGGSYTINGTTASTLDIGGGGTLGSNAYTSTAYAPLASPTFTGLVTIPASTTGGNGILLPHGTAPTSPTDGALWSTTAGFYGRVNGATVGPFGAGGGGGLSEPLTLTLPLVLSAGSTTNKPMQFVSGALLTTPLAGAVEFLTDKFYGTITTGAARKTFAFLESPVLVTPNIGVASGTSLNLGSGGLTVGAITASSNANLNGLTAGSQTLKYSGGIYMQGLVDGELRYGNSAADTFSYITVAQANGRFQLGQKSAAAPVAQTLAVQDAITGTTNAAGALFTFDGSISTGSGLGGAIRARHSDSIAASTTQNALAETWRSDFVGMKVASGKQLWVGNAYVATVQVPTGYIVIYDSGGTAYKVSVNV